MTTAPPLLDVLVGDAEIAALFTDDADLKAMLRVETALAQAEAEAGLIPIEDAARIAVVCAAFEPDWAALAQGLAQDGVVIPALLRQARGAIGGEAAASLHKGATSQDMIDTSLVLRLGKAIAVFERRLEALVLALERRRDADGRKPLMAHTRMQVALPITAGDKIGTWLDPLRRHALRLADIKPRLLVLQLGGPVGTRADLGDAADEIAAGVATRLGLKAAPAWHAQRDALAEFGSWLSLVSGALGKMGQDLALMAQNEIAAVTLAGGGASSAMTHKQNPVAAEVLVALARFNAGLLGTLHQALVHENERSGTAWTLEWLVLPRMVVTTGASLRLAATLVDGLSFT